MSTMQSPVPSQITGPFAGLVDDAAIFPPGNAPLPEAVAAHQAHLAAPYAALLGGFVVADGRLPDLLEILRAPAHPGRSAPLGVTVVVAGGAGAVEPAVRWATDAAEVGLRALEVALRDEDDLARNAQRMTTVVDQLVAGGVLGDDVPVYVEPPRLHGADPGAAWLSALDEVAAAGLRLKFRTGGVEADAFPSAHELACCIGAALDREVPFKCTAGLHNAVRHRDPETGFEHHGFLNVLLATRVSLDGAPVSYTAEWLEEHEASTVADRCDDVGDDGLVSARRWFASFGSCSVLEPLQDLIDLDLIASPDGEQPQTEERA